MSTYRYWIATALAASLLVGCASKEKHADLVKAEEAYESARSEEKVARYARDELNRAEQRLQAAQAAWDKDGDEEEVGHLSYLVTQQVEIARATAGRGEAEDVVGKAEEQRQQIRMQARNRQIEQAELRAQSAEQRAQQLEKELQDLNAKQTNRGVEITLGDVLFDTGSAVLKPQGVRSVQKLAQYLADNPQRRVLVEGFTDSVGSETFNEQLSQRRADSVRDVLLRNGINGDRIETLGYGEAFPVASNADSGGRQLNRRVEVIISDESGQIPRR